MLCFGSDLKERQTGPECLPDPVAGICFDALDFEVWSAMKKMAVSGFDLSVFHLEHFDIQRLGMEEAIQPSLGKSVVPLVTECKSGHVLSFHF